MPNAVQDRLREAAKWAREAELTTDRIDTLDLTVIENGIVVVAMRNGDKGPSLRRVKAIRSISWEDLAAAEENPLLNMIRETVVEMNREPTTHF